jgi:hypothetical protein
MEWNVSDIVELERRVWQALVDGDAKADAELLDEGFLGVYPSGFAAREDHAAQLDHGPTIAAFAIREPRMIRLAESSALLAYRAEFRRRSREGAGPIESMYVSSIWRESDGQWTSTFSQDSPAELQP